MAALNDDPAGTNTGDRTLSRAAILGIAYGSRYPMPPKPKPPKCTRCRARSWTVETRLIYGRPFYVCLHCYRRMLRTLPRYPVAHGRKLAPQRRIPWLARKSARLYQRRARHRLVKHGKQAI